MVINVIKENVALVNKLFTKLSFILSNNNLSNNNLDLITHLQYGGHSISLMLVSCKKLYTPDHDMCETETCNTNSSLPHHNLKLRLQNLITDKQNTIQ